MASRGSGLQASPYYKFGGGLDETAGAYEIADDCLQACDNIHLDAGRLYARPGRRKWGAAFASTIRGIAEAPDGSKKMLVAAEGKLWSDDASVRVQLATGLTDETVRFSQAGSVAYLNGSTVQKRWDGTTLSAVGLVAPASAPVAAASGVGLTGSYAWVVTYVIKSGATVVLESNPSPVSNSLTLSGQGCALSSIPAPSDSRVTHMRIYRSLDSGSTYYFEAEKTIATTATCPNLLDAALGDAVEPFHSVPDHGDMMTVCNGRSWWIVESRVFYSEIGMTEAYREYQPTLNFYPLPGAAVAIRALYDSTTGSANLFIFLADRVLLIPGGIVGQQLIVVSSVVGCIAPQSIVEHRGRLGFYSTQQSYCMVDASGVLDISTRRIPLRFAAILDHAGVTAAIAWSDYLLLSVRDDSGVAYRNRTLVCDLRTITPVSATDATATWTSWTVNVDYWVFSSDNKLYGASNADLRVWQYLMGGQTDETAAGGTYVDYNVTWTSKAYFGTDVFSAKRACTLRAKGTISLPLTVTAFCAMGSALASAQVQSSGGKAVFIMGASKAGDYITQRGDYFEAAIPATAFGESIWFQFSRPVADTGFVFDAISFTFLTFQRRL